MLRLFQSACSIKIYKLFIVRCNLVSWVFLIGRLFHIVNPVFSHLFSLLLSAATSSHHIFLFIPAPSSHYYSSSTTAIHIFLQPKATISFHFVTIVALFLFLLTPSLLPSRYHHSIFFSSSPFRHQRVSAPSDHRCMLSHLYTFIAFLSLWHHCSFSSSLHHRRILFHLSTVIVLFFFLLRHRVVSFHLCTVVISSLIILSLCLYFTISAKTSKATKHRQE